MVVFRLLVLHQAENLICFSICLSNLAPSCFAPLNACFRTHHVPDVSLLIVSPSTNDSAEDRLCFCLWRCLTAFLGLDSKIGLLLALWAWDVREPLATKECVLEVNGAGDRACERTDRISLLCQTVTKSVMFEQQDETLTRRGLGELFKRNFGSAFCDANDLYSTVGLSLILERWNVRLGFPLPNTGAANTGIGDCIESIARG
jgi:hypothetical protein